jgi:hypothetical protein
MYIYVAGAYTDSISQHKLSLHKLSLIKINNCVIDLNLDLTIGI